MTAGDRRGVYDNKAELINVRNHEFPMGEKSRPG
jgi:hypothetical protein